MFDLKTVVHVTDERTLVELEEALRGCADLVFDLETTGLDPHDPRGARISMASFTLPQHDDARGTVPLSYVLPLSHPGGTFVTRWKKILTRVARIMFESSASLVGHNVKFDCKWIHAHTGVDLTSKIGWDTMVAARLLDENQSGSLKATAERLLGVPRWDDHDLSKHAASERVPYFELAEYAARDTFYTWQLLEIQRDRMLPTPDEPPIGEEEIEEARLGQVASWVSMPTVAALTRMEQSGMLLDLDWVAEQRSELEAAQKSAWDVLVTRYDDMPVGSPSFAPTSKWFLAWTEKAVEADDLRIIQLTGTGRPAWGADVLQTNAQLGSEVAQTLLDYRHATKALEFLASWEEKQRGGVIRATFNIGRVRTGRLSSEDPNLQQVSKSLRPAFRARPGHLIVEADYSQVELRVAAVVAPSEPMILAIQDGADLHTLMAAAVRGCDPADVTKADRQMAKAVNFGFLFGQGAAGFKDYARANYGVDFTPEESFAAREAFFTQWEGLEEWHQRIRSVLHRDGQVTNLLGRVRRLPEIWDSNDKLAAHAVNQAINFPVQSLASDILMLALASVNGLLPGTRALEGVRPLAPVHDSLVVEVEEDGWQQRVKELIIRMTSVPEFLGERFGIDFPVPLVAEAEIGPRWAAPRWVVEG